MTPPRLRLGIVAKKLTNKYYKTRLSASHGSYPMPVATPPTKSQPASVPSHYTEDNFLREYGFAIRSRPPSAEPTWVRNNRVYTHAHALQLARVLRLKALADLKDKANV